MSAGRRATQGLISYSGREVEPGDPARRPAAAHETEGRVLDPDLARGVEDAAGGGSEGAIAGPAGQGSRPVKY